MLFNFNNLSPEERLTAIDDIERQIKEGTFDPTEHFKTAATTQVNKEFEGAITKGGIVAILGGIAAIAVTGSPILVCGGLGFGFLQIVMNATKKRQDSKEKLQEGNFVDLLPSADKKELDLVAKSMGTPKSPALRTLLKVEEPKSETTPEPQATQESKPETTPEPQATQKPPAIDLWHPKASIEGLEFLPADFAVGASRSGKSLVERWRLYYLKQKYPRLTTFYMTAVDRPSESGYFESLVEYKAIFPIKDWFARSLLEQAFSRYHALLQDFQELKSDRANPKLLVADELTILVRQANYLKLTYESEVGTNFIRDLINTIVLLSGGGKESGEAVWALSPNGAMGAVGMARHEVGANDPIFVGNLDAWNPIVYQTAATNKIAPSKEPSPQLKALCKQAGTNRIIGYGGEWYPLAVLETPSPVRTEPLISIKDAGESGLSESQLADLELAIDFLDRAEPEAEPEAKPEDEPVSNPFPDIAKEQTNSIEEAIPPYLKRMAKQRRADRTDKQICDALKKTGMTKLRIAQVRSALAKLVDRGMISEKNGLYRVKKD